MGAVECGELCQCAWSAREVLLNYRTGGNLADGHGLSAHRQGKWLATLRAAGKDWDDIAKQIGRSAGRIRHWPREYAAAIAVELGYLPTPAATPDRPISPTPVPTQNPDSRPASRPVWRDRCQVPTQKSQGNSNNQKENSKTAPWNFLGILELEFPWNSWVGTWNFLGIFGLELGISGLRSDFIVASLTLSTARSGNPRPICTWSAGGPGARGCIPRLRPSGALRA
jgi:hypothetical protein